MENSTVFVLVADLAYLKQARRTIIDLRSKGEWHGDIVLIPLSGVTVGKTFTDFYRILTPHFQEIKEKQLLADKLNHTSFEDTIDGREITKMNQWEKLHVFDPYFLQWKRVVFLDAGMRVLDNVHDSILKLDCSNCFMAPDDGGNFTAPNPDKLFETQISKTYFKQMIDTLNQFGGIKILKDPYFLNCIWIYDTAILQTCSKKEMIAGMLEHPICKTNEMVIMNLYLHFRHGLWKPFPKHVNDSTSKILFDWCESNNPEPSTWRDYSFLKYPCTITFEET
jgi:hypothetical protein